MKKWFQSKEYKKITVIIMIMCLAVIAQIIGLFRFNRKMYDMSLEHSMQQVDELSGYVEKNLHLELEQYINVLRINQLQMAQEESIFCKRMMTNLAEICRISGLKMMGISDLDGRGVDSTGKIHNISYKNLRQSIENDEVYISNVLNNGNETLIFIGVPLKIKGEISGILWGKYGLSESADNIQISDSAYKYFQIVDDKGNYLFTSRNKFALKNDSDAGHQNIWNKLEKYEYADGMTVQKIAEMVQNGEQGNFYIEKDGEGRYVSFRPLKINNWYLFAVQVDYELQTFVHRMRDISFQFYAMLAIGLAIIFGMIYNLIYSMYKRMVKQHREIQAINVMLEETLIQTRNIAFAIDFRLKQMFFYGFPGKEGTYCCPFSQIRPQNMLERGIIDGENMDKYQKLYQSLIVKQEKCPPVVLHSQVGQEKRWMRVSIVSKVDKGAEQIIGVLEDYDEQKEKDLQIENHLDDIKKIKKKSKTDFLTKIYNREAFLDKIQTALEESDRNGQTGALLIMDLDHFKDVNDTLGHGMGDTVLQETANVLKSFFRKDDIVGRLGGDEFVVFTKNIRNVQAFEQRIKELNKLLCNTYHKAEQSVQVSASIGIALTDTEHFTFEALYEGADQALYQVKNTSRNGYQIYSEKPLKGSGK